MAFSLEHARALVNLSEDELRARLSPDAEVEEHGGYERLDDVTEVSDPALFDGWIYVRDGRVELLYTSGVEGVSAEHLKAELEGGPEILASRGGKSAAMYVWPGEGVAYSAEGDGVQFVEVFRPRTLEEYRAEIYEEPGPFIR